MAVSSNPFFCACAPVNEPFSCPKSSLSSRVSVTAAQLMATKGREARGLLSWIARAANSLPVPLSPWKRTVDFGWRNFGNRFIDLNHARAFAHQVVSDLQLVAQAAVLAFQVFDLTNILQSKRADTGNRGK